MKIFDPEGPLMTALAKLSDAVFCNIMFCLCSLPIFTIGAALAALYDCTMSIVEDTEKPSMFKQYWTSFRKNFKQATLLWLICLGVILILAAYSAAVGTLGGGLRKTYQVVFFFFSFLFLARFQYVFPVQALMDLPVKDVLKTAWFLSAAAFPCTLGALAVLAAAVFLSVLPGQSGINMTVFLWAVIGFGLTAYLQCFFFRMAFRRLKRIRGETEPEELPDPWETDFGEDSKDEKN